MAKVNFVPHAFSAVTPHLVVAGAARAIEFYKKAFGAVEDCRVPMPDGRILHAQLRIGGAPVMLVDEMPQCNALGPRALGGTPVTIHLFVPDADAFFAGAVAAGATPVMPVQEMFWGDRYGQVADPFGHRWSIATHVRDVSPAELAEAAKAMCAEAVPA